MMGSARFWLFFCMLVIGCFALPVRRYEDNDILPAGFFFSDDLVPRILSGEAERGQIRYNKRAMMRLGKRAMMRLGKRAMMRLGKK